MPFLTVTHYRHVSQAKEGSRYVSDASLAFIVIGQIHGTYANLASALYLRFGKEIMMVQPRYPCNCYESM